MSRNRAGPRAVDKLPADRIEPLIGQCMLVDQPRLRGWWRKVQNGGATAATVSRFEALLEQSAARARARAADRPPLRFPAELPVSARRDELAAAISGSRVVVVCGATGSGKSTQLPKICLAAGRGQQGMIGHTQPRRIAARAVATRIAEELGEPIGGRVGFKIRFRDRTGDACRIKLMTDGILLAELQHDRWLRQYDTLIIDEAHERSLNIDFLLGYLKQISSRREDLKLVITSATIDPQRLADHFGDAPIVEVSGRSWPIETRYRPPAADPDAADAGTQSAAILDAVAELSRESGGGDMLVFLPGERDIRETADALRRQHPADSEILPLFSRLSNADQDRVFQPSGRRRIILATNIAETSLTVPGIRYVIDTGRARISRYSHRSKIQQLQIEPISRASAEQRKGRCGRQREGICIRLYAEEDLDNRPAYTDPEILRTNLASVILQMEALQLGNIGAFPFLDPPDRRLVRDGYRLLRELQAVDADDLVTRLGRRLSRLPVDPRLGRALLAAGDQGCLRELAPVAAFLSIRDPRERPADQAAAADECHRQWQVAGSDLLGIVRLWDDYLDQRRHLSVSRQRRWCRERFLSFMRMREWYDVHQQLHARLREADLAFNSDAAPPTAVHRAFLAGFLGHIGQHDEAGVFRGPRGGRFGIAPGSVLAGGAPRWVVAAELVRTRRVYARHVAEVQSAWIESAARHLVRRRYESPRWHARRGHVVASETVSLYGLVLAGARRVDYGRIDAQESRRIFIREALVADDLDVPAPFREHNRSVIAEVTALEDRLRRRDLLASPAVIADFYAERLPTGICTSKALRDWLRASGAGQSELLRMCPADVLATQAPTYRPADYPDLLEIDGNHYSLGYRYAPGEADDGVTLTVLSAQLGALDQARLDWLIPGWLPDKVVAMIRALPKPLRRRLVPAPDVAQRCLETLTAEEGSLPGALAAALQRVAGVPVPDDSWHDVELPAHLSFNVRVVDDRGQRLGEGRDLADLQRRFQVRGPLASTANSSDRRRYTTWSFGAVEETALLHEGDRRRRVFLGLHDAGDGVTIGHYGAGPEAAAAHRLGSLRLFRLACTGEERYLRKELAQRPALRLALGAGGDMVGDVVARALQDVFVPEGAPPVRDGQSFEQRLQAGRPTLVARTGELAELAGAILESWRAARVRLETELDGPAAEPARTDIDAQLAGLVYPGFLRDTPARWLGELPRYLRAVHVRLDRLATGDHRDPALTADIARFQQRYDAVRPASAGTADPALETFRWMLEEYRVSLFAQALKTALKVSPQRLDRQWEQVELARRRP